MPVNGSIVYEISAATPQPTAAVARLPNSSPAFFLGFALRAISSASLAWLCSTLKDLASVSGRGLREPGRIIQSAELNGQGNARLNLATSKGARGASRQGRLSGAAATQTPATLGLDIIGVADAIGGFGDEVRVIVQVPGI